MSNQSDMYVRRFCKSICNFEHKVDSSLIQTGQFQLGIILRFFVFVFLFLFLVIVSPSVSYIIFGGHVDGGYFEVEKDAVAREYKILGECVNTTVKTADFTNCVSKCYLEQKEVFNAAEKYNGRLIQQFYMNQSNATNSQIDKLLAIYSTCKTEADNSLERLRTNGEVERNCKFFGLFSSCVVSKYLIANSKSKGNPKPKE